MSVSDSAREQTVQALTRHCGDGRITLDELEQRIELAYAAETPAELAELVRDLPSTSSPAPVLDATRPVQPAPVRREAVKPFLTPQARKAGDIALRVHLVVYLSIIGLLSMIWLLAGGTSVPFWPIWVAMPWGTALAIHAGVHKAVWAGHDDERD